MAVVTDRGHGREGPVMDDVMTDRGLAGLTTDVVVHLMDQDPHEKALDYSVSDPEKHRVDEVQYFVVDHKQQHMHCMDWNSVTVILIF